MIAIDTNILIYAHRAESEWHDVASKAIRTLAEGRGSWAIPWPCLHEFLSIVTNPRIFRPPTPAVDAIEQIKAWLKSDSLALLGEGSDHFDTLTGLALGGRIVGPQFYDARIAAICINNRVDVLWTADRDFQRFPALSVANPLVVAH